MGGSSLRARALACAGLLLAAAACGDAEVRDAAGMPAVQGADLAQAAQATPNEPAHHVTLDDGPLIGALDGRTYLFAGIPYARPPLGALRFRRPQPNLPWSAPRDATRFQKRCLNRGGIFPRTAPRSDFDEDCLYLNVWTPVTRPSAPMPVLVWLGGGSRYLFDDGPALPGHVGARLDNGRGLADRGIVVVTIETRRGALGHFAHPALEGEDAGGNQGLRDQQRALAWVQQNIARFGGDPAQVTLAGQDARATDACLHVVAPSSRGLFRRVVAQSGSCTGYQRTRAEGERAALALSKALGCAGDGPEALACMRQRPGQAIDADRGHDGEPVVDGTLIPEQPRVLFERGEIAPVDFIIGSTRDEGVFASQPHPPLEVLPALATAFFGASHAEGIVAQYTRPGAPDPTLGVWLRILSDGHGICASYELAELARQAGAKVWMYLFDVRRSAEAMPYPDRAAAPGDDVPYVFGTVAAEAPAVTESMQTYWSNFVKRGDPSFTVEWVRREPVPTWPELGASAGARIVLAPPPAGVRVEPRFATPDCELWRARYPGIFALGRSLTVRR